MSDKQTLYICVGLFASLSTLCWSIAIANMVMPPSPPKSAMQICADRESARNSVFCMELVKATPPASHGTEPEQAETVKPQ